MSCLVPFPWTPLPTGFPPEAGWQPGSCGHSGTLQDSPSDLSVPLSSLRLNRYRSGRTEEQAGHGDLPPFTQSSQLCPESGSKNVGGHLWLPSSPQSMGAGQLGMCNAALIPEHLW